ncbi:MAG: magnesium/cobalt transporter CorA [Clostridia bacterium]|nr:magnesium/cobalt transporter CorA [Clostridia bacterium]
MIRMAGRNGDAWVVEEGGKALKKWWPVARPLWVDVREPNDGDWSLLTSVCGLHPLALEDCRHPHELPKIEEVGDHLFVLGRRVTWEPDDGGPRHHNQGLFLAQDRLISVEPEPSPDVDTLFEAVRKEPARGFPAGTDLLAQVILHACLTSYLDALDRLAARVEKLETQVLHGRRHGVIRELDRHRSTLAKLRRGFGPLRDLLLRLARDPAAAITPEARTHFRDTADLAHRIAETMDAQRELLHGVLQVYLSLNVDRTNAVMERLTVITAVFLPLTLITGIYGMNFRYMPELAWPYAYPATLAGMALLAAGLLVWFRQRGWLGR